MNPYLIGFLIIIATIVAFEAIYWAVHHKAGFINLGRIAAGALLLIADSLDQLNALPWGTILTDVQARLVAFGIALALMLKQAYDKMKAANQPPQV